MEILKEPPIIICIILIILAIFSIITIMPTRESSPSKHIELKSTPDWYINCIAIKAAYEMSGEKLPDSFNYPCSNETYWNKNE